VHRPSITSGVNLPSRAVLPILLISVIPALRNITVARTIHNSNILNDGVNLLDMFLFDLLV
jgi:hypothetical protein